MSKSLFIPAAAQPNRCHLHGHPRIISIFQLVTHVSGEFHSDLRTPTTLLSPFPTNTIYVAAASSSSCTIPTLMPPTPAGIVLLNHLFSLVLCVYEQEKKKKEKGNEMKIEEKMKKKKKMKTPLLPSSTASDLSAHVEGGSSVTSAVFNLSTTIIGWGIMSLPTTLTILGVGPAFFLIAFMAFLCDKSAGFMLKYTSYGASSTYAELMGESFGKIGSKMPQLCIMFSNFGGLVMYLMIIGDVISGNGLKENPLVC